MEETWSYEKLGDDFELVHVPANDLDGSITGRKVYGLKAWFDENPEERKRLGWIKHEYQNVKEIQYDKQTQFLLEQVKRVDECTVRTIYHVVDKSQEMLADEETGNTYLSPYSFIL